METVSAFFAMPSFERRSTKALMEFIKNGGEVGAVKTARISKDEVTLQSALAELATVGVQNVPFIDRKTSRSLWGWVWANAKDVQGTVIVDATCFTRELLGMLLFALSVRREYLDEIHVQYVSTGLDGYATQNKALPEAERWLSRGIYTIRSVVGYPGNFRSERRRRVVALAGHERDRLLETIEFLEPDELSISSERSNSSTVEGAAEISQGVVKALRDRIPVPKISDVDFSANSITETYKSLNNLLNAHEGENIAIVPMNTKLSFIGAALAALHNQDARLMYAVPEEYNPLYSCDEGPLTSFDITSFIKDSRTIPVLRNLAE